jgi:hypothetical protein
MEKEYIDKVHSLGWAFQGSTNGVTYIAEHAMKDKNGKPRLDHFKKPGRYWADMKNKAYQDWYVKHMKKWVELGADSIQRDEPTTCRRTPYPVAAEFFKKTHKQFYDEIKREYPLSCNLAWNKGGFAGKGWQVIKHFDYGMSEYYKEQVNPYFFRDSEKEAAKRQSFVVFTGGRNLSVKEDRLAIAGSYASGATYIVPWDQFTGIKTPRYFGKPKDFADLYGFIRACSAYLDRYEAAAQALPPRTIQKTGIADTMIGNSAFTAFMVTQSEDSGFGISGNAENGNGGIPRLYLQRGSFSYNVLKGVSSKSENGKPEITAFIHDGKETISISRNNEKPVRKTHADFKVQKSFGGGGYLSIPFQGANKNHSGIVSEIIIFGRKLSQKEEKGIREYLGSKYLGLRAKGISPDTPAVKGSLKLWFKAESLVKNHKDGTPVTQWKAETGQIAFVSGIKLPNKKSPEAPVFKPKALNGHPGVSFDGDNDFMLISPGNSSYMTGAIQIKGGSGQLSAYARAIPDDKKAPVVIHLIDWGSKSRPSVIRLRTSSIFNGKPLEAKLVVPIPYKQAVHEKAEKKAIDMLKQGQRAGGKQAEAYADLKKEIELKTDIKGDFTIVNIPVLNPWGLLIISSK